MSNPNVYTGTNGIDDKATGTRTTDFAQKMSEGIPGDSKWKPQVEPESHKFDNKNPVYTGTDGIDDKATGTRTTDFAHKMSDLKPNVQ